MNYIPPFDMTTNEIIVRSYLEAHIGSLLCLYSESLFSRDRIRKGIAFFLLNKYGGVSVNSIISEYNTSYPILMDHIEYAQSKASDQINLLISKISTHE